MSYWGDFPLDETLNFLFTTRAFATGIPTVLAGTPVLSVYEDTNLTQITAGVTVTVDHDAVVGLNRANVVATSGNGYEVGKSYNVVITTGTVGGVSVVGEVIGIFTVERGSMANAAITTAKFATGAVNAAAIATDAIGSAELAADCITNSQIADSGRDKINAAESFHNLTADSGTTTTLVDAALTEVDNYFNNMIVVFTGGPNVGISRTISNFVASTDTITLQPGLINAVGAGDTYFIAYQHGPIVRGGLASCDVRQWISVAVNALIGGAVDVDVSAIQNDVITAASIAAAAIGSSEAPNLDAAISSRATPAQVNTEVSDVLKTDTVTLPGQLAPPLTPTFEEMLSWLYKTFRNRKTQTATQWSLLADDESTVDAKATVSDAAGTATKEEIVTGP